MNDEEWLHEWSEDQENRRFEIRSATGGRNVLRWTVWLFEAKDLSTHWVEHSWEFDGRTIADAIAVARRSWPSVPR